MDLEIYQQLEQVKANIEAALEQARKGLTANAEHLFDDGWYDKFVWKVQLDASSRDGIFFLLVPKNELEFRAWSDVCNNIPSLHSPYSRFVVVQNFRYVLYNLGMDWQHYSVDSCGLHLLLDLDNEAATTVFPKLIEEEKIVIENDEELLKKIEQLASQIEKEAEEKINSLRSLGQAVEAVAPF